MCRLRLRTILKTLIYSQITEYRDTIILTSNPLTYLEVHLHYRLSLTSTIRAMKYSFETLHELLSCRIPKEELHHAGGRLIIILNCYKHHFRDID